MMSLFQKVKDYIKAKKLFIRVTLPWFGEKGMKEPMPKDRKVTNEGVNQEIQDSLKKEA